MCVEVAVFGCMSRETTFSIILKPPQQFKQNLYTHRIYGKWFGENGDGNPWYLFLYIRVIHNELMARFYFKDFCQIFRLSPRKLVHAEAIFVDPLNPYAARFPSHTRKRSTHRLSDGSLVYYTTCSY